MSQRHSRLTKNQLDAEQKKLYETILDGPRGKSKPLFPLTSDDGSLNGPFGLMLHAPALGDALQDLGAAIRCKSSLSNRLREIGILRVAVIEDSDFEWFAHERVAKSVGVTEEELQGIRSGRFCSADEAEQAGYDMIDAVLQNGDVSDETFDRMSELLGPQQVFELVVLTGYYRTLAQTMRVFGVGAPED